MGRVGKRNDRQQAIFRRRRIVVGVAAVAAVALVVFCVYSLSVGFAAVNREIHHAEIYAVSRKAVPTPSAVRKSKVAKCNSSDVALTLTPAASSFGVGGTLDFTTGVRYDGANKAGCLIDMSATNVVLTIRSGGSVVWKSNLCPVDADYRLIAKGDKVEGSITWPGVRSGSGCTEDQSTLPKVEKGVYSAQISLTKDAKAKSEPVGITVE